MVFCVIITLKTHNKIVNNFIFKHFTSNKFAHLYECQLISLRFCLAFVLIGVLGDWVEGELSVDEDLVQYSLTIWMRLSFRMIPSGTFRHPQALANNWQPAWLKFFLCRNVSLTRSITFVPGMVRPSKTI